jgi:enamine deaminase RidA (YjgF/YER057c/UK114 family)
MQILLPAGWPRPKGYSNGIAAEGRMVYVAGQVGWTKDWVFEAEDLVGQFRQTLENTKAILAEAGAGPEHMVRMTWYITNRDEYIENIAEIGAAYREILGKNYPVMAVVQVVALMEAKAKVEIETTAVIPR